MMWQTWALFIVGLVTIADGSQYLGRAPFSSPTENGMSYARKESYEYEFDPEMYIGYNRQDNKDNGTSLSASGHYIISNNKIYIRLDQRDCKPNFVISRKVCMCYEVEDEKFVSTECANKKGFVPFCVDDSGATFLDKNGNFAAHKGFKSFHFSFNMKIEGNEENLIYGTNFLGDGLHSANPDFYEYTGNKKEFVLVKAMQTLMKPKKIPMYIWGKMNLVDTIHMYFPGCARIDYFGLVYGGDLLTLELDPISFIERPRPNIQYCPSCQCT